MSLDSKHSAILLAFAILILSQDSFAASPGFIFDPIEAQAQRCAVLGSPWDKNVNDALRKARAATTNFLPSKSWDQVLSALPKSAEPSRTPADVASCEKFIAYYADPKVSAKIRGPIVAGLLIKAVTGCAAAFPDISGAIRTAWVGAFSRNGLDPMEQLFDEGVRTSWRRATIDTQLRHECDKTLLVLASKEFDQSTSEEGIKRLLGQEAR
jgi:hypothetical protein